MISENMPAEMEITFEYSTERAWSFALLSGASNFCTKIQHRKPLLSAKIKESKKHNFKHNRNSVAHRKLTGLILHYICGAWHVKLPARIATYYNVSVMRTLWKRGITRYNNRLSSESEGTLSRLT